MAAESETGEFQHFTAETIFPLTPASIHGHIERLRTTSDQMLSVLVDARRSGPVTEFAMNMLQSDLGQWHVEQGHFEPEAELAYNIGLMYGVDIGQHAHATTHVDTEIVAEDPAMFETAIGWLRDSYESYHGTTQEDMWRLEKRRQTTLTGSDIFAAAALALSPKMHDLIEDAEGKHHPTSAIALQAGLTDGAVAVDAYWRLQRGLSPQQFETGQTYFPEIPRDASHLTGELMRIYTGEDVAGSLDLLLKIARHEGERHLAKGDGYIGQSETKFYQISDNVIAEVYQVIPETVRHWTRSSPLGFIFRYPEAVMGLANVLLWDMRIPFHPEKAATSLAFGALAGLAVRTTVVRAKRTARRMEAELNSPPPEIGEVDI